MLGYLGKEEEKMVQEKGGRLLADFIERALGRYDGEEMLRKNYETI